MRKKHILNISAIHKKMKQKPEGQRLHLFFSGMTDMLTKEQIYEVKQIVVVENKKMLSFLRKEIKSACKREKAA